MSGDGPEPPLVIVPATLARLLDAVELVASSPTGPLALVGGLAITARVSTAAMPHRATVDIDLVVDDTDPPIEIVLARSGARRDGGLYLADLKVDVIATNAVADDDLDGLTDGQRLFVARHRWVLETAQPLRLSRGDGAIVSIPVGTPAGLFAAKSHAAGFPSSTRRATKHGGDLYDLFRLAEAHDRAGALSDELAQAPGGIAGIIADVVRTTILSNPARARGQMALVTDRPLDVDELVDVLEPLADALAR